MTKISKKTVMIALIGACLLMASGCASEKRDMADYIGIDAAQEAAVAEAGIDMADADFSVSGLDSRDGTFYYEVRFTAGDSEYEYAVDALTGTVIEEKIMPLSDVQEDGGQDKESAETKETAEPITKSRETQQEAALPETTRQDNSADRGYIGVSGNNMPLWDGSLSEEEARQVALSDAGVSEDDIAFILVERDWDDGKAIYDVEFMTSDFAEYDYEIDAVTGEIRSMDQDMEHQFGQGHNWGQGSEAGNGGQQGYGGGQEDSGESQISEDEAKSLVLERVPGASAGDIRMKLDFDDGRLEYEGELYHDGMEYEFKIDAYSGSVIEWESERLH